MIIETSVNPVRLTLNFSTKAASADYKAAPADYKVVSYLQGMIENEGSLFRSTEMSDGTIFTTMTIIINKLRLFLTLVLIDAINDGYAQGAAAALEDSIGDIFVTVDDATDDQLTQYAFVKGRETSEAAIDLNNRVRELEKLILKQQDQIKFQQNRMDAHLTFIHSYVDLRNLTKVVYQLAEETDSDALDNFDLTVVH